MQRWLRLVLVWLSGSLSLCAQTTEVALGPVFGAVTPRSAVLVVGLTQAVPFQVELVPDPRVGKPLSFTADAQGQDSLQKVALEGLSPNTRYQVRILDSTGVPLNYVAGNYPALVRQFTTAPETGSTQPFRFTFSSCQGRIAPYTNMPIYLKAAELRPAFHLQVGDWGYPDTTDAMPDGSRIFTTKPEWVARSYRAKYRMGQMQALLAQTPVDHMYDDHDYANENSSRTSSSYWYVKSSPMTEAALSPGARENALLGYQKHFPHYPLPNAAEGSYHSFTWGPCEFFVVDNRACRSPNTEGLTRRGDSIFWNPPPTHTLLDAPQREWLLNGLRNSKATWKFIITGTSFNQGNRHLIDTILKLPKGRFKVLWLEWAAERLAAGMIDSWSGFQLDSRAVMETLRKEGIRNVVALSGDTHTWAIDDGGNGGIPEVMCGGINEYTLALPLLGRQLKSYPWNVGGMGIRTLKQEPTFGCVDVLGTDSIALRVINAKGKTLARRVLHAGQAATPAAVLDTAVPQRFRLNFQVEVAAKPEPRFRLHFVKTPGKWAPKTAEVLLYTAAGELVFSNVLRRSGKRSQWYTLACIPPNEIVFAQVISARGQAAATFRIPAP